MTERTRVRRLPERGVYDRETIRQILDSAFLCHVGITTEHGPVVLPTLYAVEGDWLYLHGSTGAHMLRAAKQGAPVCVAVTTVQGIVVARAVFHNSINYRSVVLFGTATEVTDVGEKMRGLEAITNHILPGRWDEARGPNNSEFVQTMLLKMPIDEASAKVRVGLPKDDEPDFAMGVWAGVLPLGTAAGTPVPDSHIADGRPVSESVGRAAAKWSTAGQGPA